MIILEKPYVSEHLLKYLATSKEAVLSNEFSRQIAESYKLNLIDEKQAAERCKDGERLYTTSENALDWIYNNLEENDITKSIKIMKDKAKLRTAVAELYKDFYFKELSIDKLEAFDISTLKLPVVLKLSVGFFSLGVYSIFSADDWHSALKNINQKQQEWRKNYPDSVVGTNFIIEQYITGAEYAIDAYFDDNGKAVILSVFTHRFASQTDVSDRIYYTSKELIEEFKPIFEDFFEKTNKVLKLKNCPVHVEVRIQDGMVIPIEFNPMRFMGHCCADISYFAFGINEVDYYLNNKAPNFDEILKDKAGKIYSLIVLDKADTSIPNERFDYQKLISRFENVLELRKVDIAELNIFGFLFTETSENNTKELDDILTSDLNEFVIR